MDNEKDTKLLPFSIESANYTSTTNQQQTLRLNNSKQIYPTKSIHYLLNSPTSIHKLSISATNINSTKSPRRKAIITVDATTNKVILYFKIIIKMFGLKWELNYQLKLNRKHYTEYILFIMKLIFKKFILVFWVMQHLRREIWRRKFGDAPFKDETFLDKNSLCQKLC